MVHTTPGTAAAITPAGLLRAGRRGLRRVLTEPDPAPGWWRAAPWRRQAAGWALGAATLVLAVASLANGPTSRDLAGRVAVHAFPGVIQQAGAAGSGSLRLFVLALLAVLPVPLAVRYPLMIWRLAWLAFLLMPISEAYWWGGWPWYPVQVPVLLAVFCLAGMRHQREVLWWMWGLTAAAWWLWSGTDRPDLMAHVLGTIALTAVTIVLDNTGSRRRAQQALTVATERTELTQAQLTVLEERARIARELHDVVAHHMSLIAVRAESAPYRLDDLPEPVQAEFRALSATARAALTDMRRLLGVLRHDQPADLAPQPQLSDLPVLVEAARQAGVPVEFLISDDLTMVPAGVGVCAYRIVQESLSNAGRHAPGAPVSVSVGQEAGSVVLRVASGPAATADSGQAPQVPSGPAAVSGLRAGHGLAGMRERVALLGGSLSAGQAPGGGFVVSAVLPLGGAL
jgi:signal transduction histidine kinase